MVLGFFLLFRHFSLSCLSLKKRQEVIKKVGPTPKKIVEIFEYNKNNDKYKDRAKLHQQVENKALLIAKVFHFGYLLLFIFNNITSYSLYAKDTLQVKNMNKTVRGQ